jgi:hypothetical protein
VNGPENIRDFPETLVICCSEIEIALIISKPVLIPCKGVFCGVYLFTTCWSSARFKINYK